MTADDLMKQLLKLGNESTRKTYLRHGCPESMLGVKIGDMKPIIKKIGIDSKLAKDLYKTGQPDAQYFAGLICHGRDFTKAELEQWAKTASWKMVSEYTVAWTAAEHPDGWSIGLKWIDGKDEERSTMGWQVLASIVSSRPDEELDLPCIKKLLQRIVKGIAAAPNRTKYTMNSFVIAVGGAVVPLLDEALAAAKAIGQVEVDMGDTDCKTPDATVYIRKIVDMGRHGKKRKAVKC